MSNVASFVVSMFKRTNMAKLTPHDTEQEYIVFIYVVGCVTLSYTIILPYEY